ncbi:MAG TPA: VOC family protein [Bacillales bacterium]|nr:VOC family protein [Bacillales bacterium]
MDGILGVEEITFFVQDVGEAKEWYIRLLGSKPVFEHPDFCSFQLGETSIGLHPADGKTPSGIAGQVAYWRVENLEKIIEKFVSHGCEIFRGPIVGVDGVKICQTRDPFGNAWGLIEKKNG